MNSDMLNVLVGLFLPAIFLGVGGATSQATLVGGWYVCLTVVSLLSAFAGRGRGRPTGLVIVADYVAFVIVGVAS